MLKRQRVQILLLSILLHILLISLWEGATRLNGIIMPATVRSFPENPPLVFDLSEPQAPREVIETPADAKQVDRQQNADYLSDKNALARNQDTPPPVTPKGDEPYARGDFESHELPLPPVSSAAAPEIPAAVATKPNPTGQEAETQAEKKSDLRREIDRAAELRPEQLARKQSPGGTQVLRPGVNHRQIESMVEDMGGLSFNTYNWNFAPYLLELKRRIQGNIFPPVAFTQLGLIDGNTLMRFKIYPNGELRDMEVILYRGHVSLMETSTSAVTMSAPFPRLPNEFPEKYLEITAKFIYIASKDK